VTSKAIQKDKYNRMASLSQVILSASQCPLCHGKDSQWLAGPDDRTYFACQHCALVYCDVASLPDPTTERERYLKHRNSPVDGGYLAFLQRAVGAAARVKLIEGDLLDFGCGHTPVLADVLKTYPGITLALFDPLFFPDPAVLNARYDIVFCIEVVEHFHDPRNSWQTLTGLLKPGALLTIMTHLLDDPAGFSDWYYARDRTHVCFYQPGTMDWIADLFKLKIIPSGDPRVCLMCKEN
jgi:SAM-dependent methyltransferase